jgi:hypothetical protein
MTFWLMAAAEGNTPELIKQKAYILMPCFTMLDWSQTKTRKEIKQQLLTLDEDAPPESLALKSQLIGRFMHEIHTDDVVCIVWKKNNKPKGVCFAKVTGKPFADLQADGQFENRLPIEWYKEEAKMLRLRPYIYELGKADDWPTEISNKKFKQALRNHLPLPGNKFVRWGWLIVVLVCIKLFMLAAHMWQRSL